MKNLEKYSNGQVNVCGVNHFSATNTKVGKQYSKGMEKDQLALLKKEPMKTRAHSKDSSHLRGLGQRGSGNIIGSKKLAQSEKQKKLRERDANLIKQQKRAKLMTEPLEHLIAQASKHGIVLEEVLTHLKIKLQDQNNGELTATLTQSQLIELHDYLKTQLLALSQTNLTPKDKKQLGSLQP